MNGEFLYNRCLHKILLSIRKPHMDYIIFITGSYCVATYNTDINKFFVILLFYYYFAILFIISNFNYSIGVC